MSEVVLREICSYAGVYWYPSEPRTSIDTVQFFVMRPVREVASPKKRRNAMLTRAPSSETTEPQEPAGQPLPLAVTSATLTEPGACRAAAGCCSDITSASAQAARLAAAAAQINAARPLR